jgi:hypothetical protein
VINNRTNLIIFLICILLPAASYGMREESIYQNVQALWDEAATKSKYTSDNLVNDVLISSLKTDDSKDIQNEVTEAIKGRIALTNQYDVQNCDVDALSINILNTKKAMANIATQNDNKWPKEKKPNDQWYEIMAEQAVELSKTNKINLDGMLKIISEIIEKKAPTKGPSKFTQITAKQITLAKKDIKETMKNTIIKVAKAAKKETQEKEAQEKIEAERIEAQRIETEQIEAARIEAERAQAAQEKEEVEKQPSEQIAEREPKKKTEEIVIEEQPLEEMLTRLAAQEKEQEKQIERERAEKEAIEQARAKEVEEAARIKAEEEAQLAELQRERAAAIAAQERAQKEQKEREALAEAREQAKREQRELERIEKEKKEQQEAALAKEKIEKEAEEKERFMDETRNNIAKAFNGAVKKIRSSLTAAAKHNLQVIFIHPEATQSINYVTPFKDVTFSEKIVLKFSQLSDGSIVFIEQGNDKDLSPIIIYPDNFSSKDKSMLINIPKEMQKRTVSDTQGKERFERLLTSKYNKIFQSNLDLYKKIIDDTALLRPLKKIENAQKIVSNIKNKTVFSIDEIKKYNAAFLNLETTNAEIRKELKTAEAEQRTLSVPEAKQLVAQEHKKAEEKMAQEKRELAQKEAQEKEEQAKKQAKIEKIRLQEYQQNVHKFIEKNRAEIVQAVTNNDFKALDALLRLDIMLGLQIIFVHPDATECIDYVKKLDDVTLLGKKLLEFSEFKDGSLLLVEQSEKPQVVAIYPRDLRESIFSSDYSSLANIPDNLIPTKERDAQGIKLLREIFTAKANQIFKANLEHYKKILDDAETLGVQAEQTKSTRTELEEIEKGKKLSIDEIKKADAKLSEIKKTNELTKEKIQKVVPEEPSIPVEKIREQVKEEIKEAKKVEELTKTVITPQVPVQTPVTPTTIVTEQPVTPIQPTMQQPSAPTPTQQRPTQTTTQQPSAPTPTQQTPIPQQYVPEQYQMPMQQQPWIGTPQPQGAPMEYWQYYLQQPAEVLPTEQPWQVPTAQQFFPEAQQSWNWRHYLQSAQSWWQEIIQRYFQPETPEPANPIPAVPVSAVPPARQKPQPRLTRSRQRTKQATPTVPRVRRRNVKG